jgi:diguanylate cyclase (GGDEF)-like protein
MHRSRTVVVTGCVLAAVLALLSVMGYVGLGRLRHTIDDVAASSTRLQAYQTVQRALADEAVAEAAYRRAPSEATQAEVVGTLASLDAAAARIRDVGDRDDEARVAQLLDLNHQYAREVVTTAGASRAGVTLQAMQGVLDDGVLTHAAEMQSATDRQRHQFTQMAWRAPLALLLSFGAVGLCWVLLVASGRRAAVRAEASEQLALRDPLTGLGNRRAFERLLAPELARPHPDAAVLLVDLDGFKAINDTWGHDVGDEVLKAVADRLRETARGSDFVARIGGDEFAVLARPALHVEGLSERLSDAISQPLPLTQQVLHPSASIGWASVGRGTTQEDLLREADRMLYARKRDHLGAVRRVDGDRRTS